MLLWDEDLRCTNFLKLHFTHFPGSFVHFVADPTRMLSIVQAYAGTHRLQALPNRL